MLCNTKVWSLLTQNPGAAFVTPRGWVAVCAWQVRGTVLRISSFHNFDRKWPVSRVACESALAWLHGEPGRSVARGFGGQRYANAIWIPQAGRGFWLPSAGIGAQSRCENAARGRKTSGWPRGSDETPRQGWGSAGPRGWGNWGGHQWRVPSWGRCGRAGWATTKSSDVGTSCAVRERGGGAAGTVRRRREMLTAPHPLPRVEWVRPGLRPSWLREGGLLSGLQRPAFLGHYYVPL